MGKTYAIIPAGGKGTRAGGTVPKQYKKFNNKELIVYTLEVFQKNSLIEEIIISAHPDYFKLLNKLKKRHNLSKITHIVEGGKERQDSVYNGLCTIKGEKDDFVAVHDAARPLLPQKVLSNAVKTAIRKGNALVCIKAKDTLVKGKSEVIEYVNRQEIMYVQTPQIFKYIELKSAMEKAKAEKFAGTDESMLVERVGHRIHIVEGSVFNFKVTEKEDFDLFKQLLIKH